MRVCARTFDPRVARGRPQRWNEAGQFVLYLAEHFSTTILESVVHAGGAPPPPAHAVWADIPDIVSVDTVDPRALRAGWDDPDDYAIARRIGASWYRQARTAALIVPSVPGRPYERNIVVNTTHADAAAIVWANTVDVPWDPRLFS
ncbi:MAG TPA: RES family NAD+ phosphorylase [Gemmatimonadaceae bacterium]|nr:RES family NAD+ phosphorylase [Gemmatimonadaceae bacterium]